VFGGGGGVSLYECSLCQRGVHRWGLLCVGVLLQSPLLYVSQTLAVSRFVLLPCAALCCPVLAVQEDLSETTAAVEPLCRVLLADPQPQEVQQHVPQIVQVCTRQHLEGFLQGVVVRCIQCMMVCMSGCYTMQPCSRCVCLAVACKFCCLADGKHRPWACLASRRLC
jgi:hypothetical protein